jgi:Adenylate and Guanylate cyclase catalytic domain
VRCAVDIQSEMRRQNQLLRWSEPILFRIEITIGDIIIDDADIFGDGVNIAARLEPLAEPGGICVSRIVRDQVRDKLGFGFEDLGHKHIKNIARAVHVFKISLDAPSLSPALETGKADAAARRGGLRIAAAAAGLAAVVGTGSVGLKMVGVPMASPDPILIGDPIFFERDRVGLTRAAETSLLHQAEYLREGLCLCFR